MNKKYIIYIMICIQFTICISVFASQFQSIYSETIDDFQVIGNHLLAYHGINSKFPKSIEFNNINIESTTDVIPLSQIKGDRFQTDLEFHYVRFYDGYILTLILLSIQFILIILLIVIPFYRKRIRNLFSKCVLILISILCIHFVLQGFGSSDRLFNWHVQKQVYSYHLETIFWAKNPNKLYRYISYESRDVYGEYTYSITLDGDAVIVSAGTDGAFQYSHDQISNSKTDDLLKKLVPYSPTNGLQSDGDLWMLLKLSQNSESDAFEVISGY